MSVQADYKLLLDVNRDLSFSLELPVMQLEWANGMAGGFDTVADVTTLRAVVSNADGALTRDVFGDFVPGSREEDFGPDRLTNGGFDDWTGGELDGWDKFVYRSSQAISETASGGSAGTGSLTISGPGAVGYRQTVTGNRLYELTITISQFTESTPGPGYIALRLWDGPRTVTPLIGHDPKELRRIQDSGTFTVRFEAESLTYLEVYFDAGPNASIHDLTVTIDEIALQEVIVRYRNRQIVKKAVPGADICLNGNFDDWTGGLPDHWGAPNPNTTVVEVGSGEDENGAGSGSVHVYSGVLSGAWISQLVPFIGGYTYRVTVTVSYIGDGVNVSVAIPFESGDSYYVRIPDVGTWTFDITHPGIWGQHYQAEDFSGGTPDGTELWVVAESNLFGGFFPHATIDSIECVPLSLIERLMDLTSTGYVIAPDDAVLGIASPFRGTLMRLVVSYRELENVQLWEGKVDSVTPTPGIHGERVITITCRDPMQQFREQDYLPRFATEVTVDQALTTMLRSDPIVVYPYAQHYWILGVPGCSELGINTTPFDGPPMDFDTGVSVIPFVGDNSDRAQPSAEDARDVIKQGVSALGFVRDLMGAEVDGRFFWDGRRSTFVFHNRHHDLNDTLPVTVIRDWDNGDFIVSDIVYTEVTVHYQPREVGSPASVLWEHPNPPLRIERGETISITVRYADPDGEAIRVGAMDVLQLVKGVDVLAFSEVDGSGPSRLRRLHTGLDARGGGAVIHLTNGWTREIFVTHLQLRGTPLRTYRSLSETSRAPDALAHSDPQPFVYRGQLLSDRDAAKATADFLLARFKDPKRRFKTITYTAQVSDERMRNALSLTVGSVIRVESDFLGHTMEYIIVGEQHSVDFTVKRHQVTYVLKPRGNLEYWILGDPVRSVLGVSTVPVF